jgi:cytochrome c553
MKNIVVLISAIIVLGLMVMTYQRGPAFQGGEAGKIVEDIAKQNLAKSSTLEEKSDREKEDEKINALRAKAGNMSVFKVSDKYRSKCASCHGSDGTGMQNGKKMMGPKLFGQSEDKIYKALVDFKTGRVENSVMRGLLLSLNDDDFKELAKEISEFKARAKAAK